MEDYSEIQKMVDEKRAGGAFVFMPSPILSMENSFYMPVMSEGIILREDEVYKSGKKYRAHYRGLLRFAGAASVKWSANDTHRTDKETDKMYCSFKAVGGVRDSCGEIDWQKAEKDTDLEVVEMELEDKYIKDWSYCKDNTGKEAWKKNGYNSESTFVAGLVRRDMIQKRKNKLMFVESGAKARIIRFVLGLQDEYSDIKKLQREHFFIHYSLNPKHPDVRRRLLGSLQQSQCMIYGSNQGSNQIAYTESNLDSPDAIDITAEEPKKPEQEGFKPPEQPDFGDGNLIDFENSSLDEQVKTLQYMCKSCGENYSKYDGESEGGIYKTNQKWRNDFFNWLKGEMEKTK